MGSDRCSRTQAGRPRWRPRNSFHIFCSLRALYFVYRVLSLRFTSTRSYRQLVVLVRCGAPPPNSTVCVRLLNFIEM
jgi:hypothetical protein